MADARTYRGSCHCGAVTYEATIALEQVVSCNCSRCQRLGWLMTFIGADQFKLLGGEDALTSYHFNTHNIDHLFCSTCGIESFARGRMPDGTPTVAINARCLEGVEPDQLTVTKFNGRAR